MLRYCFTKLSDCLTESFFCIIFLATSIELCNPIKDLACPAVKLPCSTNDSTSCGKDNNLKELVEKKERKPFSVSVLLSKKEEESLNKIEQNIISDEDKDADDEILEDLYLNVFPQDIQGFTDDDPADLTDSQKQELGVEENIIIEHEEE